MKYLSNLTPRIMKEDAFPSTLISAALTNQGISKLKVLVYHCVTNQGRDFPAAIRPGVYHCKQDSFDAKLRNNLPFDFVDDLKQ